MARKKRKWDRSTPPIPDFEGRQDDFIEVSGRDFEEGDIVVWWMSSVPSDGAKWWYFGNQRGKLIRALTVLVQMEIVELADASITDNVGGIMVYEDGKLWDWMHPTTGEDTDEYLSRNRARVEKRLGIRKPKKRKAA